MKFKEAFHEAGGGLRVALLEQLFGPASGLGNAGRRFPLYLGEDVDIMRQLRGLLTVLELLWSTASAVMVLNITFLIIHHNAHHFCSSALTLSGARSAAAVTVASFVLATTITLRRRRR